MKYLLTFNSTTATFMTDNFLDKNSIKYPVIKNIVSIPAKLTDTCFGIGIDIEVNTEDVIKKLYVELVNNKIDFKHFWKDVNNDGNYIIIDNVLGKKDSN